MRPAPEHQWQQARLPYAWKNWNQLYEAVCTFLELPPVKRALVDDAFRMGEFQRTWVHDPKGVDVKTLRQKSVHSTFNNYDDVANEYNRAANQTQKQLALDGAKNGMREMTIIQEKMNLLLQGSTLHGDYKIIDYVTIPAGYPAIEGLRMHTVLALKVLLSVTTAGLDPCIDDRIVTESHALHVQFSYANPTLHRKIPRLNAIGTRNQIEEAYGYDDPSGDELFKRIQGAHFRLMQLNEAATEEILTPNKYQLNAPKNASWTTMMSEVCTAKRLRVEQPTFFRGQWGIGPVAPLGESISFEQGNVRLQILNALPWIAKTILHYPTDNPVIQKR